MDNEWWNVEDLSEDPLDAFVRRAHRREMECRVPLMVVAHVIVCRAIVTLCRLAWSSARVLVRHGAGRLRPGDVALPRLASPQRGLKAPPP